MFWISAPGRCFLFFLVGLKKRLGGFEKKTGDLFFWRSFFFHFFFQSWLDGAFFLCFFLGGCSGKVFFGGKKKENLIYKTMGRF